MIKVIIIVLGESRKIFDSQKKRRSTQGNIDHIEFIPKYTETYLYLKH
jgi:hypothetical protein